MRKLTRDHFAFLRGVVQGLPMDAMWDRYMYMEGDASDLRLIRRAILDLRSTLATVALRMGKPGTARLLRMQVPAQAVTNIPTLDLFAQENGLEDACEADQMAAYMEEFGRAIKIDQARGRLIARQLRALNDLEDASAAEPKAEDPVGAWFPENIAKRLQSAGIMTLFGLASRMSASAHWWRRVPGIGEVKAKRIHRWMQENGLLQFSQDLMARTALAPVLTQGVAPILWESGANLAAHGGVLGAHSDLEAVRSWLADRQGNTLRAYRREAERLILWSAIERGKPLSGLNRDDMLAYRQFLSDPQPRDRWCAPRHINRKNPAWRPFEGPLSPAAIDHAMSILTGMFEFLTGTGYLKANPATRIARVQRVQLRQQFGSRLLTPHQWRLLRQDLPDETPRQRRLALVLDLLYATGLRISELAAARFEHLQALDDGWLLQVVGKGGKFREVPVPSALIDIARDLAIARGVPQAELAKAHLIGPVSGPLGSPHFDPIAGLSVESISPDVVTHAKERAEQLRDHYPEDAKRIAQVSAHWLRHTHASHALEAGVDLAGVQANLGHASLATTSVYVTEEQKRRLRQMRTFWGEGAQTNPG
jgi:site-specific recombinase XerD